MSCATSIPPIPALIPAPIPALRRPTPTSSPPTWPANSIRPYAVSASYPFSSRKEAIPLQMPAAHPFNPLALLRLLELVEALPGIGFNKGLVAKCCNPFGNGKNGVPLGRPAGN